MLFLFASNQTALTKRLAQLYAVTVLGVAALSIGGQAVTQRALSTQAKDAHTINIAGRQRMLSQEIAKLAYATQSLPAREQPRIRQEMEAAIALFQQSHDSLQSRDQAIALSHQNSPQVRSMFAELEPDYRVIRTAAQDILNASSVNSRAIAQIAEREADFLQQMNQIVYQYDQEATNRVLRLQTTQKILLALTFLTLLPMLLPIYQVTQKVNAMLATIRRSSAQVGESSMQIAATGEQLASMASEQAAASAQITVSSKEIASVASQLQSEVAQVVSAADEVQAKAIGGEKELSAMADAMVRFEQTTQQVEQQLATIHDRAQDIDQVVVAMTKISDQINLLSLNAAIEAEKAGASGAGFSVVAREIRTLADKSAIATLDIEALVQEMRSAVDTGVAQMERFTQQVEQGVSSTAVVSRQLEAIISSLKTLLSPLNQIKQGMTAQFEGVAQIRDAMDQLSAGTEQTVQALQDNNSALLQLQVVAEGLQEAA